MRDTLSGQRYTNISAKAVLYADMGIVSAKEPNKRMHALYNYFHNCVGNMHSIAALINYTYHCYHHHHQ